MRNTGFLVAGLLAGLVISAPAGAQDSLPILRGIVLPEHGPGRAYFEDPATGTLAGYVLGDIVGGRAIERIEDERVIVRRGDELVQILLGGEVRVAGPSLAGGPSSGEPAIIASGQPWLERLGIPPQALSEAIEQALPAQSSDNLQND